jgi:hypothetical protein
MEIMPIAKFNTIQKEKLDSDIKNGIILELNKYFILTLDDNIKKYGYVLLDQHSNYFWFKTKLESINYMNDILKDN